MGNFLSDLLANIGIEMIDDPKSFREWFQSFLDDSLSQTTPQDFEQMYERDFALTSLIEQSWIDSVKKVAREAGVDPARMRRIVNENFPYFDKEWIIQWLKKDHKQFYYVLMQSTNQKGFEDWLVRQITDIKNLVTCNLD